jgi:hypothetical protein
VLVLRRDAVRCSARVRELTQPSKADVPRDQRDDRGVRASARGGISPGRTDSGWTLGVARGGAQREGHERRGRVRRDAHRVRVAESGGESRRRRRPGSAVLLDGGAGRKVLPPHLGLHARMSSRLESGKTPPPGPRGCAAPGDAREGVSFFLRCVQDEENRAKCDFDENEQRDHVFESQISGAARTATRARHARRRARCTRRPP